MSTKPRGGTGLRALGACVAAFLSVASLSAAQSGAPVTAHLPDGNAREAWQRVPDIFVALDVGQGARVADVGAGEGFFTLRLARIVGPTGRVIAEDIDAEALQRLRTRLAAQMLTNVEVVQGEVADPRLPADALDAILIVNAYHEMARFDLILEHCRQALKPGGRLVLVEPLDPRLRGDTRAAQTREHSIEAGFADRELRAAGFDIIGLRDPFIRHGATEQWLMIAERGAVAEPPARPRASVPAAGDSADWGTDAERASAELRISTTQLKALLSTGHVLLLDVRDADSYVAGHLPGAILAPLSDLAGRLPEFTAAHRPIVAYCT